MILKKCNFCVQPPTPLSKKHTLGKALFFVVLLLVVYVVILAVHHSAMLYFFLCIISWFILFVNNVPMDARRESQK